MKQVTAALMMRDDRMFIARRAMDQKLVGLWEFPGGKIEAGEAPEECLSINLAERMTHSCFASARVFNAR